MEKYYQQIYLSIFDDDKILIRQRLCIRVVNFAIQMEMMVCDQLNLVRKMIFQWKINHFYVDEIACKKICLFLYLYSALLE